MCVGASIARPEYYFTIPPPPFGGDATLVPGGRPLPLGKGGFAVPYRDCADRRKFAALLRNDRVFVGASIARPEYYFTIPPPPFGGDATLVPGGRPLPLGKGGFAVP